MCGSDLKSDAVLNPAHYVPTATDSRTQFVDCLKAYGVNLAPGANTKAAPIPEGPANRCSDIINTYPDQVQGRRLPLPAPVTAGGVTYTVTSMQIAGNLLKISWQASGAPIDDFAKAVYPPQAPADSRGPGYRVLLLQAQYLDTSLVDSAGDRVPFAPGGGGKLPRARPYTWRADERAGVRARPVHPPARLPGAVAATDREGIRAAALLRRRAGRHRPDRRQLTRSESSAPRRRGGPAPRRQHRRTERSSSRATLSSSSESGSRTATCSSARTDRATDSK